MIDWNTLLVPIAVLGVLLLFRLVGCDFGGPIQIIIQPYPNDVLFDNPVVYYRMQEAPGSVIADDKKNFLDGQYGIAGANTLPLLSNPAASTYLSLPIASPSQELAAPSILLKRPNDRSVRFNGSFVSANGSLGDLSRFSVDALVRPEWDIANERNFYCVIDHSNFVPGLGATGPNRNAGFAVYGGPDNPADPSSAICWQLWIGTGTEFARANPVDGSPGPLVLPEETYLAVQFTDDKAFLWGYTLNAEIDRVKFELIRPPYVQATDPNPAKVALRVGISGEFAGLIPPFPSPPGFFIYPFVGRIAEVAVYDDLGGGRIMSHIVNSFNTTP